jgi:hypothetical protein
MKFPAHFNLKLSPNDNADLLAAQRSFIGSMRGLSEAQQLDRAKVIAGGIRPADPYTRALATQVVEGAKARGDIQRLQRDLATVEEELRQGGHRPKDPHWRAAALVRKDDLQRELENTHARLVGIAEDTHETAKRKAAVEFRQARQQQSRNAALKESIANMEARLDQEAIDREAEAIVKARRAGLSTSSKTAGDSQ